MGHLVNPTGLRLGFFSNWSDRWAVSSNFLYAEMLHLSVDLNNILRFFLENFITDRFGILYSHSSFEKRGLCNLDLKFYFYDGFVENRVFAFSKNLRKSFAFTNKFNKRRWRYFRGAIRNWPTFRGVRYALLTKLRYYDYLLVCNFIKIFFKLLWAGNKLFSFKAKRKILRLVVFSLKRKWFLFLNSSKNLSISNFIVFFLKYIFLKIMNRVKRKGKLAKFYSSRNSFVNFKFFERSLSKFFFDWLRQFNFFRKLVARKRILWKFSYRKYSTPFSYIKAATRTFFLRFYRSWLMFSHQLVFFKWINKIVSFVLKKIGFIGLNVKYLGIDNTLVNAMFLSKYIARKLEMKFRINELLYPVSKELIALIRKKEYLLGYKVQFVGRLTRRDRVRVTWVMGGILPLTDTASFVEHSTYVGILRNGVCCLRVWLSRPLSYDSTYASYNLKIVS